MVVEIGPGLGALTSDSAGSTTCGSSRWKRTADLCVFLRERFAAEIARGRLDLRDGDALELLPRSELAPAVDLRKPALLHFHAAADGVPAAAGHAGAAFLSSCKRKSASGWRSAPGNKTYGALSVLVQAGYEVELVRTSAGLGFLSGAGGRIGGGATDAAASRWSRPQDRERFAAVVQRGFSQRRKKLSNLLPTEDAPPRGTLSPARMGGALAARSEAARYLRSASA